MSAIDNEGVRMRIWFKIFDNTHLIKDETIENYENDRFNRKKEGENRTY